MSDPVEQGDNLPERVGTLVQAALQGQLAPLEEQLRQIQANLQPQARQAPGGGESFSSLPVRG